MKKLISGLLVASVLFTGLGLVNLGSTPQAEASITNWHRSASVLPNTTTDLGSEDYKASMRNLKATGANMVTIIVPYYQSNQWASDLGPGYNTPTDESLVSAMDYAQSIGLQVVLKMHAENSDWTWRAFIEPTDRDSWYQKYGDLLNHLADLGQAHGAEGIIIGAEMIKTATYTSNQDNTQRWIKMINDVRSRFSGYLTYSANWGDSGFYDEVSSIGFWPQLDYVGISAYYDMNSDGSVEGIMQRWNDWRISRIEPLRNKFNKQILFTEVGYRSVDAARYSPWDSGMGGGYNATEQATLYEAMFKYWSNYSYFAGVSLWRWSVNPNDGGTGNTYYWPQHKPAEEIMKKYWLGGGVPQEPTNPGTTTPPITPTGNWNSQASINNPQLNAPLTATVSVTSTDAANGVLVDAEIYNSNGNRVFQQYFENKNFSANQAQQFQILWTPTEPGQYTVKLGIFSNNWSTNYYWDNALLTFTVNSSGTTPPPATTTPPTNPATTTPPTNPQPTEYSTNIWWPSNGASVTGVQPFKAMLEGLPVSDYKMYWQVDGDQLNEMFNSDQDYPHKESLVDVTGWNWKGAGPYTLNFISKTMSGSTISQKSVNITVSN